MTSILDGQSRCPHDDDFVHEFYYGCVPADFKGATGRSKTRHQTKNAEGRYKWNGGCDATTALDPKAG